MQIFFIRVCCTSNTECKLTIGFHKTANLMGLCFLADHYVLTNKYCANIVAQFDRLFIHVTLPSVCPSVRDTLCIVAFGVGVGG